MFKHLVSELKETLVCLQAGQVTLGYPFQPHPPEGNFRGKVVVDPALCIGCGACAMACPPRLIALNDKDGYRAVEFALRRCTYCAQCRDVCPQKAITLSNQFETASPSMDDMSISLQLKLVHCRECGAVVGTQRALKKIANDLTEQVGLAPESMGWLELCLACKRQGALKTEALMLEVTR
jgi:formate hydrogenlyase subunit 6/NADH:ubiquinone oxidoreductase subunit I